jgi:formylglycine-generating enzyme required for sulfatase activity
VRIDRSFAVAATLVTREQFLRFVPGYSHMEMSRYPDPDCPMGGVNWFVAAMYCNWLTEKEGIGKEQCCFAIDLSKAEIKLKEKYLSLTGYRFPTEAEWEYACRAGAETSRFYGETAELLGKYAWYYGNSRDRAWPVGSKKPNDLGLFDMFGNLLSWCQESFKDYPLVSAGTITYDVEDSLIIDRTRYRVTRGGAFETQAADMRCAFRFYQMPLTRYYVGGFRVARTIR